MGDRRVVSPILCKAQHRLALQHRTGAKRRVGTLLRESSDPMIEAGAPSVGGLLACFPECARPTEGSHTRTTRGPAQRRGGRQSEGRVV